MQVNLSLASLTRECHFLGRQSFSTDCMSSTGLGAVSTDVKVQPYGAWSLLEDRCAVSSYCPARCVWQHHARAPGDQRRGTGIRLGSGQLDRGGAAVGTERREQVL